MHAHTHILEVAPPFFKCTQAHSHTVNKDTHPPPVFVGKHMCLYILKRTHTHTHIFLRTHYTIQETLPALARNANWNKQLTVSSFLRWELAVIETSVYVCTRVCTLGQIHSFWMPEIWELLYTIIVLLFFLQFCFQAEKRANLFTVSTL